MMPHTGSAGTSTTAAANTTATSTTAKARIRELETLVKRHQDLYYNGEPELSDADFDRLWDELKDLDPENPVLRRVGADAADGFPKAEHLIPMGSQEKAADPDEFRAWAANRDFDIFLVQYKLDGASLELQYRNGRFSRAVTRGDGRIGDDITANARRMAGLVPELTGDAGPQGRFPFTGGVRGEVIMTRSTRAAQFPDTANCRNAANGLMKRKDGTGCEHLKIICYDAAPAALTAAPAALTAAPAALTAAPAALTAAPAASLEALFTDELSKLAWLEAQGFNGVPCKTLTGAENVILWREQVMQIRPELDYDIDGLVVKGNAIDPADLARARPQKQIAFKFTTEEAVTTVREVQWSESGATYTPVAVVDPVQLAGTVVQRASLANPDIVRSLGLMLGSRVRITKRGEIIPKIVALVENPADARPIPVPDRCGTCGSPLTDAGTRLYCPNVDCPKLVHHRLEKWISVLDIREIGDTLLERLFAAGRLSGIPDLYSLTVEELAAMERMGEQSARKVVAAIRATGEVSLARFVAGFDIEGIGETMVEKLVSAGFTSLDSLFDASESDLEAVHQFGGILARDLARGLAALRAEMEAVLATGAVRIATVPLEGGALSGLSFCFTGELGSMTRTAAADKVKALGGQVKSSVGRGLDYLVTNNPSGSSSKLVKARELGVRLIDEAGFLAMLDSGFSSAAESAGTGTATQQELNL